MGCNRVVCCDGTRNTSKQTDHGLKMPAPVPVTRDGPDVPERIRAALYPVAPTRSVRATRRATRIREPAVDA